MLADALEMIRSRSLDKKDTITQEEQNQNDRLQHLAWLLPLTEWALRWDKNIPPELKILPIGLNIPQKGAHILSPEEITSLDTDVFDCPKSMLAQRIPGVWIIVFVSKNPTRFTQDQDTTIVRKAVDTMGWYLQLIRKNEKNENDPLTGLSLRRKFSEEAHDALEQATAQWMQMSFVIIDVDYFKKVNDKYGHPMWDFVLTTLADFIKRNNRMAVRWWGEEFWLLMQASPHEAASALQWVFEAIKKIYFCTDENGKYSISRDPLNVWKKDAFRITLSAGIAGTYEIQQTSTNIVPLIPPWVEELLESLIKKADLRLYEAKIPRDCIVFQSELQNQKTFWFSQILHILRISTIKASLISWYKNLTSRNLSNRP